MTLVQFASNYHAGRYPRAGRVLHVLDAPKATASCGRSGPWIKRELPTDLPVCHACLAAQDQ